LSRVGKVLLGDSKRDLDFILLTVVSRARVTVALRRNARGGVEFVVIVTGVERITYLLPEPWALRVRYCALAQAWSIHGEHLLCGERVRTMLCPGE
jgi:hypothetical protein